MARTRSRCGPLVRSCAARQLRSFFFRPSALLCRRELLGLLEQVLVRQRREGGHQQGAPRRLTHAGVAIVNGRIHQHPGPIPMTALIGGAHHLHPPERTDVRFAPARAHQEQLAVAPPRHGGPTVVELRPLTDDPDGLDLGARRSLGSSRNPKQESGGSRAPSLQDFSASDGSWHGKTPSHRKRPAYLEVSKSGLDTCALRSPSRYPIWPSVAQPSAIIRAAPRCTTGRAVSFV